MNEIPENRRIEDLDSWLQGNGLRSNHEDNNNDTQNGDSNNMRQNQWDEYRKYQQSVHEEIFCTHDENEKQLYIKRQQILNQYNNEMIELIVPTTPDNHHHHHHHNDTNILITKSTTDNNNNPISVIIVPVRPLAESCDTIFAFITNSLSTTASSLRSTEDEEKKLSDDGDDNNSTRSSKRVLVPKKPIFQFSLELYSVNAIYEFLSIILSPSKCTVHNIHDSDLLIECCRLAHYLQNHIILNDINTILLNSIDTNNCYSICQLADQFNLNILFERSMIHMMNTISDFETDIISVNNNNSQQDPSLIMMDQFITSELQSRILSIKNAIQSSIHSQKNHIYVSSLYEYIAIFAERVQYYTERLEEAKDQLCNVRPVGTKLYNDMNQKIIRQEQRVVTLKIALKEQKKLFLSTSSTTKTTTTS